MGGGDLFRVTADDPDYRRQAAVEAEYWSTVHPYGMERTEGMFVGGAVERYLNERFTGDPHTPCLSTISRWGAFRSGLLLGVSSPKREAEVFGASRELHVTLMDISAAAVERRATVLTAQYGATRVGTAVADLNFLSLPVDRYDLIVSSSTIHHVTNLEHLAFQINQALTSSGYFFLEDYVGEPRFEFSSAKRRLCEIIHNRQLARETGRRQGLVWRDAKRTESVLWRTLA
jgi:SAM-dependent methyltransferase